MAVKILAVHANSLCACTVHVFVFDYRNEISFKVELETVEKQFIAAIIMAMWPRWMYTNISTTLEM